MIKSTSLPVFVQGGLEVKTSLSCFIKLCKYLIFGREAHFLESKFYDSWGESILSTLFESENWWQKTDQAPISLPRPFRNFPGFKTRNKKFSSVFCNSFSICEIQSKLINSLLYSARLRSMNFKFNFKFVNWLSHYLQLKLLSGKNAHAWDSMDFT